MEGAGPAAGAEQPPADPVQAQELPAAAASDGGCGAGVAAAVAEGGAAAKAAVNAPQPALFLGFDAGRRNNVAALDDETIALVAGAGVVLLHLPSGSQRHLPSRDGGGVGALAVHPARTCFAVAEKRRDGPPNIYVYEWPSLALLASLPGGTARAYAAAAFEGGGGLLAAVGGGPDHALTLWEWREARVVLRARAFAQDVFSVGFSPIFQGRLVTSGVGHIRFWRAADTFTGLKLQGALGRFGAVELSDVAAFTELPDGRVLSGSESGALIVWDGGLVSAVVTRPGGMPCHAGAVDALLRHEATGLIVSGGGDAALRLWDAAALGAEPGSGGGPSSAAAASSTASIGLEVAPSAEVALPPGTRVRGLSSLNRRTWLVTDAGGGGVLVVAVPPNPLDAGGYAVSHILPCAAGGLAGLAALPGCHVAVTAGGDGTVRAVDYVSGAQLQARAFGAASTCLVLLPPEGARCCAALGFADGSVV
ncbi:hypothetical protein Rsub_05723 [Raphidocelis subcapitata]|uniref:Uncharacterized protein n=1 Tax=Raphidocelis subcapitata TaxID=307507 RepID=A0A2V0P6S1_9CHLO|nr:hypothetical protein Rsub_05723 [Raphidocelis subcapitata]|eukprot:GBF92887.1 hypothetical protein Rsub_05723 [Raphidocelis subcapitata]